MINSLADSMTSTRGIATILDNPIYTAIVITFIIMVIFYFSGSYGKNAAAVSRIRVSFYIFCSILAVLFVYHRRFQKNHDSQNKISEIQSALGHPPTMPIADHVPIIQPVYMVPPSAPTAPS